jgi:ATP-dependent protease HslVU (ClpYQ) ATPase subunit
LATLRFVEETENILFIGSSGVGKTHLAVSIGMKCSAKHYSTYFIHFNDLMAKFKAAAKEGRIESVVKHYAKTTLGDIRGTAGRAAKWLDDHDAGLTETVRYATKRNKVDADERERLHNEMLNAGPIGRAASRAGNPEYRQEIADKITGTATKAGKAVTNIANATKDTATSALNRANDTVNNVTNNIKDTLNDTINGFKATSAGKDFEKTLKAYSKNPSVETRRAMGAAVTDYEDYLRDLGYDDDTVFDMVEAAYDKYNIG